MYIFKTENITVFNLKIIHRFLTTIAPQNGAMGVKKIIKKIKDGHSKWQIGMLNYFP